MKRQSLLVHLRKEFPDFSKEELYAFILCGDVTVDGERIRDPRHPVSTGATVQFAAASRFVSRGGEKLEHVIRLWNVPVRGKVFADAGSSTGGFTDCLLQHGAEMVHCVDVGYNQLDYRLRNDARVVIHEKTNIMELAPADFAPRADAAVADLSFRSLSGAAAHIVSLTREGWLIALAKPQFEIENPPPEFGGVLRDQNEVESVLVRLVEKLISEGLRLRAIQPSPIRGRKGNQEFLLWLERDSATGGNEQGTWSVVHAAIDAAVEASGIGRD